MSNVPAVTPRELKEALPLFQAGLKTSGAKAPLSMALKVRCAVTNYILYGEGELHDRVCNLVSVLPIDVEGLPESVGI